MCVCCHAGTTALLRPSACLCAGRVCTKVMLRVHRCRLLRVHKQVAQLILWCNDCPKRMKTAAQTILVGSCISFMSWSNAMQQRDHSCTMTCTQERGTHWYQPRSPVVSCESASLKSPPADKQTITLVVAASVVSFVIVSTSATIFLAPLPLPLHD